MPEDDNVLNFPRPYIGPPKNEDDLTINLEVMKDDYMEHVAEFLSSIIFHQLEIGGFDTSEKVGQDLTLIHQSLKSLMSRCYGIEHPLQQFADMLYTETKDIIVVTKIDENGEETKVAFKSIG